MIFAVGNILGFLIARVAGTLVADATVVALKSARTSGADLVTV